MKWLLVSISFLLMLSLQSCAAAGSATLNYCLLYMPIYVDKKDVLTFDTEKQILIQNETYAKLCKVV